ncbi:MAG: GIY-YIG nuclease family protein [bacterium]
MADSTPSKRWYYTYVLQSKKDGKNYVGFTTDIHERIAKHITGKV